MTMDQDPYDPQSSGPSSTWHAQSLFCDLVCFVPNVHGASAFEACGAANIFDALWPTPGNSIRRQLKAQPRSCATFRAASNTFMPR